MTAIGRTFSDRTDFAVCEDHFDLSSDAHRRPSDSRYVLHVGILPHRNMFNDSVISRSEFFKQDCDCTCTTVICLFIAKSSYMIL